MATGRRPAPLASAVIPSYRSNRNAATARMIVVDRIRPNATRAWLGLPLSTKALTISDTDCDFTGRTPPFEIQMRSRWFGGKVLRTVNTRFRVGVNSGGCGINVNQKKTGCVANLHHVGSGNSINASNSLRADRQVRPTPAEISRRQLTFIWSPSVSPVSLHQSEKSWRTRTRAAFAATARCVR